MSELKAKLVLNDRVVLVSFLGTTEAPKHTRAHENFWMLIGTPGVIVDDSVPTWQEPNAKAPRRVLVKFLSKLDGLGLANHNPIQDSLWILESDLQICPF